MDRKSRLLSLLLGCMLLGGILLPACSIETTPDPPDPLAVTPADTSPDTLDVVAVISEDQDATDKTTNIIFTFSTIVIEEQNYVLFDDANEEVVCNGVHQPLGKSPSYKLYVPRGHYICTYSGNIEDKNGNSKALPLVQMFDVAPRSALSPQPPVVTSNGYSVRYTPDADDQCTVVGKATDKANDPPVSGQPERANEGVYSGPSTSSLHGTGDLFVIRTCHWQHYQPSEFANMDVTYISQASVEVTWSH
ncbi:MAG TPA: hypothetical protein VH590_02080 [Ktedonobacterales bacterium]